MIDCSGLVELHGGEIGASSAGPGQGCTFFFELPLFETRHREDGPLHSSSSSNHSADSSSGRRRRQGRIPSLARGPPSAKIVPIDVIKEETIKEEGEEEEGEEEEGDPHGDDDLESQLPQPQVPQIRKQWTSFLQRLTGQRPFSGSKAFLDRPVTFLDISHLLQDPLPPSTEPPNSASTSSDGDDFPSSSSTSQFRHIDCNDASSTGISTFRG
jgi:hypothetical protein